MEDSKSIWNYIPAAEFEAPTPPASDAARGTLRRTWKFVQSAFHHSQQEATSTSTQWDRPADSLLKSLCPSPDWQHAALGLADAIGDDWFEFKSSKQRIRPVIGPPGCDVSTMLLRLAQQRQLRTLTAPVPESLLEPPTGDLLSANAVDEFEREVLVVPHLERWYLRHEEGLPRLRALLERLMAVRNRVLIGCDSWAWAFLQHAVGIEDRLGPPLTLAALGAGQLDHWFRSTLPLDQFAFERTGNEQPIFPELADAEHDNHRDNQLPPNEISEFFTSLAVKSRGNPGVAQAMWNASLRTRNSTNDALPSINTHPIPTLWVVPPSELATPQLPLDSDRVHRFILHAILLHGGLSLSSLLAVLPFSRDELQRRVSELRRSEIIKVRNEELHVTLIAYPLVRRDLHSEGFLTDAL